MSAAILNPTHAHAQLTPPLGQAGTVRDDLEPLFYSYGVDLWINGHEHSYERTFPLYKVHNPALFFARD